MDALDNLDAEAIAATLRSPGWALIADRIDYEAGCRVKELVEVNHTEAEMNRLRGEIMALRLTLLIPKFVATEARTPKPERKKK